MAGRSASIKVNVEESAGLSSALEKLDVTLRTKALRAGVKAAGNVVLQDARKRAPRSTAARQKGRKSLKSSLRNKVKVYKDGVIAVSIVGPISQIRHAHLVEFGTAPHSIKPTKGKVLKIGSRFVTGGVQHPGARPRPFLRPAADTTKDEQTRALIETIQSHTRVK